MSTTRNGLLAGLGLCLLAGSAQAERVTLPFAHTDLNGGIAGTAAEVVLPPTLAILRAQLVVAYANALAVNPTGSGLLVGLNDEPLVELPLVATQGTISADIDIPPHLLAPGTNVLSFRARQHHRVGCDRGAFTELWTRLDAEASYLQLDLATRPGTITLRHLDELLASSLYDGEAFTIATERAAGDPLVLEWGGMAAEAVALRRGQRPLAVRHVQIAARPGQRPGAAASWRTLRGQNFALIGTFEELGEALPQTMPEGAAEGLLAVQPLPADPAHVAIIVSGGSEAAVSRAVALLNGRGTRWPDAPAMALGLGALPPPPQPVASAIAGGRPLTLAGLGYTTQDLPLSFTETIELDFDLPEDYYAGNGQNIELALDYAYGAGLAATSALIVKVNDAPWNMVRLDQGGGDIVDGARIELPMGLFEPGHNTIAFQPLLHPADDTACAAIGDQPMFTLFDDSRIEVPRFARLARQPDLRLFADRGFPYAGPDGGMTLVVAGGDPAAAAAAWTLRGKLAQRYGAPLPGVVTTSQLSATAQHVLVVGPLAALPDDVVAASTMPLGATGRAAYRRAAALPAEIEPARGPTLPDAETARARNHWAQRLTVNTRSDDGNVFDVAADWLISMARAVPYQAPATGPSFEELRTLEVSGEGGTLVAFRSPYAADRTVTVLTADDGRALQQVTARLIEDATWGQLAGDVSIWGAGAERVLSRQLATPYVVGAVDTSVEHLWLFWRTFMAENPGYWLALVFVLIVCLTLATGALLRRRATE